MLLFFYLLLFFLGAVFGSFGGVIIERGREGFAWADWKRVFGGRSYCPSCKSTLTRRQLIPLGGRLLQKGKCFRCKLQIPVRYIREELLMGLVFVLTGWVLIGTDLSLLADHTTSLSLVFWLFLNRGLILLFFADFFRYELNLYVWILLMVGIVGFQVGGWVGDLHTMVGGGVVLSGAFYGIYLSAAWWQTRKHGVFTEGFGLGDVRMAGLIGALTALVFPSGDRVFYLQAVLVYLILSSGLGIVFWILRKQISKNNEAQMPFLPAMIISFWVLVLLGEQLLGRMSI